MARILPLFVPHAGCPCQCVFCNQRAIAREKPLTGPQAAALLQEGLDKFGGQTAQAAFYGGSFTAIPWENQKELLSVVQSFLQTGAIESIRISTRPDAINEEILERLWSYGVRTIELGAQSMSDRVLALAKRGHTAAHTAGAAGQIRLKGFQLILQLMAGLPGDDRAGFVQSVKKVVALQPNGVRLYPVAVLPETELAEQYAAGNYTPLTPEQAADWCADALEQLIPAGIPVIRLGLNPTEELGRQVIAGAYHPALGELCYGEWFYRQMCKLLREREEISDSVTFAVHPSDISKAVGQNRRNIRRLQEVFSLKQVKIRPGKLERNQIEIV